MISKEAINRDNYTLNIRFTPAARDGFEYILRKLAFVTGEKILMPAYIGETNTEGSGVFDPVRRTCIEYDFYRLNKDLTINLVDVETKIKKGSVKALLVIHYFGFIQPDIEKISELCKGNGVLLIEDCAHTLFSSLKGHRVGMFGDFSFFSIHKLLPTATGGYIQDNTTQKILMLQDCCVSRIDIDVLEQYCRMNIPETSFVRIRNYQAYLELLYPEDNNYRVFIPELPEGIVPLNFPIIIKNGLREKVYFKLIENGIITCSLYYRMISEIDRLDFPLSYEISDSILNFPVHQDTTGDDIKFIVDNLHKVLKEI